MKAGHLLDILEEGELVKLPGDSDSKHQRKQRQSGISIVGSDVVSLFPSLRNIETARMARHAVIGSSVKFENVDMKKALRYLYIVGGSELVNKAGLKRHCPTWLGDRGDLITVGGDRPRVDGNWKDSEKEVFEGEVKLAVAAVVEVAVNLAMSTHVYTFQGKYFIQRDGGPIGLRCTASLAALIMKLWDVLWLRLLDKEGISLIDFLRYVDDARSFLQPLLEGWRWDGKSFKFSEDWYTEDMLSGLTDDERTTREMVAAMSSLIDFLKFEGEEVGMFENFRLPTLDTELWVCERTGLVKHAFFEKPTCPNRVLQRTTALSDTSIRASLTQEVVRRLKNCSLDLDREEKQSILSKFAQKLLNSGHSVASIQYILVHGVTRYIELLKNSKRPTDDPRHRPLYMDRQFNIHNRKLQKILAKTSWYDESEVVKKVVWRQHIPEGWAGCKPDQYAVRGMPFTTIMQVPSSHNGRLLKMLAKSEPRLAKVTGYQSKYVEKSGRPLAKFFPVSSTTKCHRLSCPVCANPDTKGPSLCQVKSVVYSVVCSLCDERHKVDMSQKHLGRYIGQTSRTLAERSAEHLAGLRRVDLSCHLVKHWALVHPELLAPPKFKFAVEKPHKSPMSRMIHEAIKIIELASMNSKSERGGYKIARLTVSPTEWEAKKNVEIIEADNKVSREELLSLKDRVNLSAKPVFNDNCVSRKRMSDQGASSVSLTPFEKTKKRRTTPPVTSTPVTEKNCRDRSSSSSVSSTGTLSDPYEMSLLVSAQEIY